MPKGSWLVATDEKTKSRRKRVRLALQPRVKAMQKGTWLAATDEKTKSHEEGSTGLATQPEILAKRLTKNVKWLYFR
jgi:hypothetical protein